jgi:hypothetical protein
MYQRNLNNGLLVIYFQVQMLMEHSLISTVCSCCLQVVALPLESVDGFLMDEELGKSAGAMFALSWGKNKVGKNGGRGLC